MTTNSTKTFSVDHFIINMPHYSTEALRLSNDPALLESVDDPDGEKKVYAEKVAADCYAAWLSLRVGQAAFRIRKFAPETDPKIAVQLNTVQANMCWEWIAKEVSYRWVIITNNFASRERIYQKLREMRDVHVFDSFNPFHILTVADIHGGNVPAGNIDFVVGVWESSNIAIHLEELTKWLLEKVRIDPINTHIVHMVN